MKFKEIFMYSIDENVLQLLLSEIFKKYVHISEGFTDSHLMCTNLCLFYILSRKIVTSIRLISKYVPEVNNKTGPDIVCLELFPESELKV